MYIIRKKAEHYWWSKINVIIFQYQKLINLLDNTLNHHQNLGQKNGLKLMIIGMEHRTPVDKLISNFDAKVQFISKYLLKDLYQLQKRQRQVCMEIIIIKK